MTRLRFLLLALLFVTAGYLFVWPRATLIYYSGVLIHVAAGAAFLLVLFASLSKIFRFESRPARWGWALLALGGLLGLVLIYTGTLRKDRLLLYSHIGACLAGVTLLVGEWAGKRGWLAGSRKAALARFAVFLAGVTGLAAGAWWVRNVPWQRANRIENPLIAPASMNREGDGPNGPFFPSSAQTADGKEISAGFFLEAETCKRCHAEIYNEWKSSAHHFSSFNNQWYRKSIEYMQDTVGIRPSKWCAGCHDPALLFSGMFDRPVRQIEDTPAGQAGLGCTVCHGIVKVKSTMGQGDYVIERPALDRLATSPNPFVRRLHDFLVELNPEPHRRVFLKPFMRNQTPQFCSVCHKVHLDGPVNHYRWVRGFNEYDNWQASGVSGEGARSFYYPPNPRTCADCHMPPIRTDEPGNVNGLVHSHRFPAANTALPVANEQETQLRYIEEFLQDNIVSVDIFAIAPEKPAGRSPAPVAPTGAQAAGMRAETTFAVGEEAETPAPAGPLPEATPISAPINRAQPAVRRGDTVRVDVVVRTRGVGHFFPGGTVDAFDCWLELSAKDENGKILFWSGGVEDGGAGPVDPGAHFYRALLIDAHGNPINKRNAWASRAVVYVRLIPPGAADTVHYRLHIPATAGKRIELRARLNYRKFSWWNTHFAFAGVHDPAQRDPAVSPDFDDTRWVFTGDTSDVSGKIKAVPQLPIVVMAQDRATLQVLPANAPEPQPRVVLKREDWQRWNDYGIGLFLQGDLRGADAAFEKITETEPENPDGWVNIGRVRLQEGNLHGAREALERALALSPHLARAHFFYAKVLRNEGEFDGAAAHLREVLGQYPEDRVARNELGRVLFLERRYADAVQQFDATLAIDPEDLEANYNLMLCYTGLGQPDRAREFEERYLRFKAEESSQALTGPYLRAHPEDNLERQAIHEHVSMPLEAKDRRLARYSETVGKGSN